MNDLKYPNDYLDYGCGYIDVFLKNNPEFDNDDFLEYLVLNNKADRDSGELADIAKFEVMRIAAEYTLKKNIDKNSAKARPKKKKDTWEEICRRQGISDSYDFM